MGTLMRGSDTLPFSEMTSMFEDMEPGEGEDYTWRTVLCTTYVLTKNESVNCHDGHERRRQRQHVSACGRLDVLATMVDQKRRWTFGR